MDPNVIVALVGAVGELIREGPIIIKTAQDAAPFIKALFNRLMGRDPTDEEAKQLEDAIDLLEIALQEPLPPKQGEDI